MNRFTLVHSPLVGPATWSAVADELRTRGHAVAVPSLLRAAETGDSRAVVTAAAAAADGATVLVGHSGAGPLLPLIADAMGVPPAMLVFVDAGVPPASGSIRLVPDDLLATLRAIAVNGRLPPWSEWFGDDAMPALLPVPATRAALTAEMPRLPLRYFETPVTVPAGWRALPSCYLRLSEAYTEDAREATRLGWPTLEYPSTHLGIVTEARLVSDAIVDLVERGLPA